MPSIYARMKEVVGSFVGPLTEPEGGFHFDLPDEEPESELKFADGAMDGITVYHMGTPEISEETKNAIFDMLQTIGRDYDAAATMLNSILEEYHAIDIIDFLLETISEKAKVININKLYTFASMLMIESTKREPIKIGMGIMEMISNPSDETKEVIRILSLCDEFTLYAAMGMVTNWENGNQELLEVAKHVHGWGRVHAVSKIEPDTDEIKEWLLLEGVKNYVHPGYSAMECFQKAEVFRRIREEINADELFGMTCIIDALLDDEPLEGISAIDDGLELLGLYLGKVQKMGANTEIYNTINKMKEYATEEGLSGIVTICQDMLNSEECRSIVAASVPDRESLELAKMLGIPYKDALLCEFQKDFRKYFYCVRYLNDEEKYMDAVLEEFRKHIPPESIMRSTCHESTQHAASSFDVDHIVWELKNWPLKGIEYIMNALDSVSNRNQCGARRVVKHWITTTKTPLKELSSELFWFIEKLRSTERDEEACADFDAILRGDTSFPEKKEISVE